MKPVSLITGGSTGIGAATAAGLLKQGHRVALTGRDADKLAKFATAQDAGDDIITLAGDTADPADVRGAARCVLQWWKRLDNVVVNAGFSLPGTLMDHTPEAMRAMVLTNVLGPALVVRECVPHLKESRGRLVLVGGVAGAEHTPDDLYSVTKWAVHALAENTRLAVAADGVGVTLVAPGTVDTPFWDSRGGLPGGPAMAAQDIADCILFALNQPRGLDLNHLQIRPLGQIG
ncbi:SDR family oxidoreductase [Streptomyces sp. NPDC048419]|uniref:SDR family oxidoreductase n=1 Tax=Streptomyces sp. NPDC048419 TaxID=3365547 RepID=UPI0037160E0E